MGYNTIIMILNDRLPDIKADPGQFVRGIIEGLHDPDRWVLGQTTVIPTRHADELQIVASAGNYALSMSPYGDELRQMIHYGGHRRNIVRSRAEEMIRWGEKIIEMCDTADDREDNIDP